MQNSLILHSDFCIIATVDALPTDAYNVARTSQGTGTLEILLIIVFFVLLALIRGGCGGS